MAYKNPLVTVRCKKYGRFYTTTLAVSTCPYCHTNGNISGQKMGEAAGNLIGGLIKLFGKK